MNMNETLKNLNNQGAAPSLPVSCCGRLQAICGKGANESVDQDGHQWNMS